MADVLIETAYANTANSDGRSYLYTSSLRSLKVKDYANSSFSLHRTGGISSRTFVGPSSDHECSANRLHVGFYLGFLDSVNTSDQVNNGARGLFQRESTIPFLQLPIWNGSTNMAVMNSVQIVLL